MSIFTALNQFEKKFAWTLFGVVLALLFGGITIYSEFIRDRRPQLQFDIISDASVLDVREKLSSLEIIYDGVDIQKDKKSLRVVVVRLTNNGAADILKSYYDDNSPLGFKVVGGSLVRSEVIGGSSQYIKDNLSLHTVEAGSTFFDPIILEANEWFTIKSLILCPEGTRPTLHPTGKIAGVKEIRSIDATTSVSEKSFFSRTFSGDFWVQVVRLVTYSLGEIFLLACVITPVVLISEYYSKIKRKRLLRKFRNASSIRFNELDEVLFGKYIEKGIEGIKCLYSCACSMESASAHNHCIVNIAGIDADLDDLDTFTSVGSSGRFMVSELKASGFLVRNDKQWHVEPHFKKTYTDLVKFVEAIGS